VLGSLFISVVGGVGEGRTIWLREDVQHAGMEKRRLSRRTLGGPRRFTGKEQDKHLFHFLAGWSLLFVT
jgi:hypothetical protein